MSDVRAPDAPRGGFFSRFVASIVGQAPRPNPDDERFWSPQTAGIIARTGVAVSAESVGQLDVVEGCMVALTGPLATLPIGFFIPDPSGSGHKEKLRDHPLVKLLNDRPNRRQTAQEFRSELFRHLALRRNFYAEIIQDGTTGDVAALEIIHPDRVSKVEKRDNGKVYYTVLRIGTGGYDVLSEDRVWHIRMSPLDTSGLQGRAVYDTSREVFGRALALMEYANDFFRNSGSSGGTITHPGTFKTDDDRKKFVDNWRKLSTGWNRHRDKLLEHGISYSPGSTVSNDAAQFIESMREAALAICRLWNIPPHRVGILDRATFSNIEQMALEFVMYTLMPFITAFEQAVQRDLILDDNSDEIVAEMNITALLRGDIASRFKAYALGRQWGWLSVNDIRKLENEEPIEGGDVYLDPLNMKHAGDPQATGGAQDGGGNDNADVSNGEGQDNAED